MNTPRNIAPTDRLTRKTIHVFSRRSSTESITSPTSEAALMPSTLMRVYSQRVVMRAASALFGGRQDLRFPKSQLAAQVPELDQPPDIGVLVGPDENGVEIGRVREACAQFGQPDHLLF